MSLSDLHVIALFFKEQHDGTMITKKHKEFPVDDSFLLI